MIMKKRFLITTAAIAMLMAETTVTAHKAAVEDEENGAVPKIEDPSLTQADESYIENI